MDSKFFIESNVKEIKSKLKSGEKFDISFYPIKVSTHWVQYIVSLTSKDKETVYTHIIDGEFVHNVHDYNEGQITKWNFEVFNMLCVKFPFLKKVNWL